MARHSIKNTAFYGLFNLETEHGVGRSMLLVNDLLAGFANVFITGTFYTGFLTENGIDILRVGIITFIPNFCWLFALFAPQIVQRFPRRRGILLFNHFFYYGCTLLATTLMPRFVHDPGQRTLWFAVLLVAGNLVNSLLSVGSQAWTMHFIPPDGPQRTQYLAITHLVNNLTGCVAALGAALLTDALAGSPKQGQVLVALRMVSLVLFIIAGLCTLAVPKEYPYEISQRYRFQDVFLRPLRDKPFVLCILIAVIWNCVGNFNAGTYSYYILNTVHMPYVLTYTSTVACALTAIFLQGVWRRLINRFGWYRVIFFNVLTTAFVELTSALTTATTIPLYVFGCIVSGVSLVGAQINFSHVMYYRLPRQDIDLYITFYNFMVYGFIFLGSMAGTWLLSRLELLSGSFTLFGLPVYGSQMLCCVKLAGYLLLCVYIRWAAPRFLKRPAAEGAAV